MDFGAKGLTTEPRQRARILAAAAASLVLTLIGGILVLLFGGKSGQPATALKPIMPAIRFVQLPAPAAPAEEAAPDLSMFGLSDTAGAPDATGSAAGLPSGSAGLPAVAGGTPAAGLPSLPAMQLPATGQLPELPAAPDWDALTAPLAAAYANAQAANVAGSIAGPIAGLGGAAINSAAVVVGDLILYSALGNNGQNVLNQLQTSLAATPGLAAAASLGAPQLSPPDLTGLTAAFAAAAATPPLGVPALPELPAFPALPDLPPLPQLPTPDQLAAGLALPALGAVGLPALPVLPPFQFPTFEAPRPPDLTPLLLLPLLGLLPSPTRMLGLPF